MGVNDSCPVSTERLEGMTTGGIPNPGEEQPIEEFIVHRDPDKGLAVPTYDSSNKGAQDRSSRGVCAEIHIPDIRIHIERTADNLIELHRASPA
jgi:hypothetical protein